MRAMQLVAFGPGDLNVLQSLVQTYFAEDDIPFDLPRVRTGLQTLLTDSRWGRAWDLRVDGVSVGYSIVGFGFDHEIGGKHATLTDLFIHKASRGLGYSKHALAAIEQACRDAGMTSIELQVENHNAVARRIYESAGFKPFDRTPMWKPLAKK